MSVLWKKIEFYKGKGGDRNRKLFLGQSPGGVSGSKTHVFKTIKWLTMSLKKLYSWANQFITNLPFLANTPAPGPV